MNNGLKNTIKFIFAYICTIATGVMTGWGITRIDLLMPLLCLFFYVLFDFIFERVIFKDKNYRINVLTADAILTELKYSLPLAFVFSLTVVAGSHLDVWNDVITPIGVRDILYLVLYTALFTALLVLFYRASDRWNKDADNGAEEQKDNFGGSFSLFAVDLKHVLIVAGIFILCWLPYYLTMFPGNLGKDTFESVDMVLGNIPWTNHHPIFFTMLIDAVFALTGWMGSYTASLAVFTFIHMLIVALTLAYITCYIGSADAGKKRWGRVSLVFFAIHPFFPMYSIYITKDVLFSCALALLVLKLNDLCSAEKDVAEGSIGIKQTVGLGIVSLLVMLLRNNGLLIIGILMVVIFLSGVVSKKKDSDTGKERSGPRRATGFTTALTLLVSVMIFLIFRTVSYSVLDIAPESFAESASIPLQQVGYVIKTHTDAEIEADLGSEQNGILKTIMPYERVREIYDLGYTDPYKFDDAFEDAYFNEHKGDFMRIWFKLLPKHFGEYVGAYLSQTAGYWHYGETNTVATQGVWEDNTIGVSRIDLIENMTGSSLYGIIEKLMLGMRKAPLLCILSSMAMQFYAVVLAMVSIRRRTIRHGQEGRAAGYRDSESLVFLPLLLLWASIMIATPAFCLFRYMFAFFILWPFTLHKMLHSKG